MLLFVAIVVYNTKINAIFVCVKSTTFIHKVAKMKKIISSMLLSMAVGTTALASDSLTMVVGTYTDQGTSHGIYTYRFDQTEGMASLLDSVAAGNPSFVAVNGDATRVYAVSEYDDGRQSALAFTLDCTTGHLAPIGAERCGTGATRSANSMPGAAPCNIMLYDRHLVTSNYNGGDISVFPLTADGGLRPENQYFDMHIDGSAATAHIHCCRVTPDRRYMLAADLGNDCIWRFGIGKDGVLLSHPVVAYRAPKGTGPRHFVFSGSGDRAYLIGELDGTVTVLSYAGGTLAELQRIQASQTRTAGSADIHLSPDGKYLYASHRLTDEGISIFSVDGRSGLLAKRGFQPTAAHPRNFAITPNGRFVLVACRDGNVIEVYRRDLATGTLTNTHRDIRLGKPVCVVFAGQ